MKALAGMLITAALVAAGIWLDIVVLLAGGIGEIVRGAHASGSLESHDIAFGIVRIVLTGAGLVAAVLLIGVVWAVFFGTSRKRPARRGRLR